MKPKLQITHRLALLALFLASPASLHAGAVADWNTITVQAVVAAARPGPTGALDVATVQAAVYDAVQAIKNR